MIIRITLMLRHGVVALRSSVNAYLRLDGRTSAGGRKALVRIGLKRTYMRKEGRPGDYVSAYVRKPPRIHGFT